ncbi:MAG: four helix bundle protein [Bacteroidetes bacterium]|nr:four helix bundle protein [Bacteroidota bacterium]
MAIIHLVKDLAYRIDTSVMGRQLLRSVTSVTANYRAALRARSKAEFYAKLCIIVEEMDETNFWMAIMTKSGTITSDIAALEKSDELLKIFSSSKKTVRLRLQAQAKSSNHQINKSSIVMPGWWNW